MFLSYAVSRWRFNRAFEPEGDDYLYRAKPTAPAIRVSGVERDALLRTFRRQFWRNRLGALAGMFASLFVLVGVGLLVPIETAETFAMIGTFVVFVPWLIVVIMLDRRLMELPARQFAERTPAAPGRTWRETYNARARRQSWRSYVAWLVILVAFAALTLPGSRAVWWALPAWSAYFGLALASWTYGVWQKHQFGRGSQD